MKQVKSCTTLQLDPSKIGVLISEATFENGQWEIDLLHYTTVHVTSL
jgi:hypothetical protein